MDFASKNKHYKELLDAEYLAADTALLTKLSPRNRFARRNANSHRHILWALLDMATPEEIIANREGKKAPAEKDEDTGSSVETVIAKASKAVENVKKKVFPQKKKKQQSKSSQKKKNTRK